MAVDQPWSHSTITEIDELVWRLRSFVFNMRLRMYIVVLISLTFHNILYFIAFDLDVTCKWLAADAVENAAAFQYNIHISPPFRVWGFWLVVGDWLEFGCLELVVRVGG